MVKRYYEKDVKTETKTVEIFECPDCGFEFNAMHEVDEQVGGWECPLCEVEELKAYNDHLEHENQLLYGRLNQIISLAEKEIK